MSIRTVEEAADYCRLSQPMVRKLIDTGRLPVLEVGRRTLIAQSDLDEYLESCRVVRNKPAPVPA